MLPRLFALLTALACLAMPAQSAQLSLAQISAYFNALKTATARFEQINADGTHSTGTLYLRRPGRMRFEYDPPETALVIASGGAILIFDTKSNQPPETYALRNTPLGLILNNTVDLAQSDMILRHLSDGQTTYVVAQDPQHPEYGSLQMGLSEDPITLRNWVLTDGSGGQTHILLGPLTTGMDLPNRLFDREAVNPRFDR